MHEDLGHVNRNQVVTGPSRTPSPDFIDLNRDDEAASSGDDCAVARGEWSNRDASGHASPAANDDVARCDVELAGRVPAFAATVLQKDDEVVEITPRSLGRRWLPAATHPWRALGKVSGTVRSNARLRATASQILFDGDDVVPTGEVVSGVASSGGHPHPGPNHQYGIEGSDDNEVEVLTAHVPSPQHGVGKQGRHADIVTDEGQGIGDRSCVCSAATASAPTPATVVATTPANAIATVPELIEVIDVDLMLDQPVVELDTDDDEPLIFAEVKQPVAGQGSPPAGPRACAQPCAVTIVDETECSPKACLGTSSSTAAPFTTPRPSTATSARPSSSPVPPSRESAASCTTVVSVNFEEEDTPLAREGIDNVAPEPAVMPHTQCLGWVQNAGKPAGRQADTVQDGQPQATTSSRPLGRAGSAKMDHEMTELQGRETEVVHVAAPVAEKLRDAGLPSMQGWPACLLLETCCFIPPASSVVHHLAPPILRAR